MFDINLLRNDLAATAERMKTRNYVIETGAFEALEAERKALQIQTQDLQQQRNTLSKAVGQAKAAKDEAKAQQLLAEVAAVPDKVKANELALAGVQERVNAILMTIPNVPQADVPTGKGEEGNIEQRRWGTARSFDFEVKDHVALGEALASAAGPQLDFEAGVKLSGTRFTVMRGPLARMHRALAQFMLDTHVNEHGFTECYVPYIVNARCRDVPGPGLVGPVAGDHLNVHVRPDDGLRHLHVQRDDPGGAHQRRGAHPVAVARRYAGAPGWGAADGVVWCSAVGRVGRGMDGRGARTAHRAAGQWRLDDGDRVWDARHFGGLS